MSGGDERDGSLVAGRITGPYGVRGWVKLHAFTDPPDKLLRLGRCQLRRRGQVESVEFDAGKRHGKGLVVHIAGVDDRDDAEAFRGAEVLLAADALPTLEEGDYYWHQLQGLQVWCRDRDTGGEPVLLGVVDYLIDTGANDVLVVAPGEGSVDGRERLLPYLPGDVVTAVDLLRGVIEVDWFIDA